MTITTLQQIEDGELGYPFFYDKSFNNLPAEIVATLMLIHVLDSVFVINILNGADMAVKSENGLH